MNPAGCTRGQMDHFSLRRFFDRSMIACLEFFCKRYQFFIRAFVAIFFAAKAKDIHSSFVNSWLFFLLRRQKISILHS